MKILIIEDEKELSQNIKKYLLSENYICEQVYNFSDALDKISLYAYDCILLDLHLPGGNGLNILEEIKRQGVNSGIIIISAKGTLDDKLEGLKVGADDYLSKPFPLSELSMRIYALLRRKQFSNSNTLKSNDLEIHLLSKKVVGNNQDIVLTKTEYELLLYLVSNRNKVISKNAIAEHLSGDMADMLDSQNFVYAHIKNLKLKLADVGCTNHIKNIYGTGYQWVESKVY